MSELTETQLEASSDGGVKPTNDCNDHLTQAEKDDQPPTKIAKTDEHASVVAAHYNHLEEKGLKERFNSPKPTNDCNDHLTQAEKDDQPPTKIAKTDEHASVVAAHYNHLEEKGLKERFNSPKPTNDCNDHLTQAEKDDQPPTKIAKTDEHASVVAAHYNHLEEKGLKERFNSPIFYLRNFNNWVKSVLIQEYTDSIREKDYGKPLRVLDICCGKGGDLSKWQKARVERVVFADIAQVSVQQCETRYEDLRRRCGHNLFAAEFIAADCTKETLRDKYADPSINFDIVSCQFGLHYSFESLMQARRMLTNISECLKPGGYFFGTIPDAYEIVSRAQKSQDYAFGNRIFNIKLLFDPKEGYPLFGGKYDFHLEGVVDCPEFLVNFELFVKLAAEYGLELVYKARFADFYKDHSVKYKQLLHRIICFESYPAPPNKELIGEAPEYEHARIVWEEIDNKKERDCLGTMSVCEWEVATIYMAFAFKKQKHVWDSNGKPSYIPSADKKSTE